MRENMAKEQSGTGNGNENPHRHTHTSHKPTREEVMAHGHFEHSENTGASVETTHPEHTNHAGHSGHNPEMFLQRFWLSLLLTIPILLYSDHIQIWFGFSAPYLPGSTYIPAVLGIFLYFYGGWVFDGGRCGHHVGEHNYCSTECPTA